ncbi:MAG: gliding motility-associated C-terminal domain-containing protein [Flavobacteriales bacterium]|nr:gliding motility-associated C-terminal domain-containing protein [Flavobacteriales bacterium]
MKRIIVLFILSFFAINTYATHNRAGEITYRQIGPLTYEVTITTYTKADAPADRCELTLHWGDGNESVLYRSNSNPNATSCESNGEMVDNNIKKNIYMGIHTYSSASIYTLYMLDPNRNEGVLNITNSVDEPFYITSVLMIGTGLGYNSSPVLLNPPTDFGCINTPYIHNVSAFDADGDSLSYKMVNCRGANGREIETTYTPSYNLDKVTVDNQGTIHWESPILKGIYNIAVEISEHRKDPNSDKWITIGKILRDIQIDVLACNNTAPTISALNDYCGIGGDTLKFIVKSDDADGDKITLTAVGGPLEITPKATFPIITEQTSPVEGEFKWITDCSLARRAPYQVTFKANDFPYDQHGNRIPGLSTQKVIEIRVMAPPIENLTVAENINTANFDLSWDNNKCLSAIGYKIYRKEHSGDYNKVTCQGGLPDDSEYELIGKIDDISTTTYTDNNNNIPLKIGVQYCYIVTSILFDESESIASDFACATLKKRLPVLTNVDIEKTSGSIGEINIIWSKPTEIDPIHLGPYGYKLYRADGIRGSVFTEVSDDFTSINDTVFFDSGMDTYADGYNYRVDFYNKPDNTSWVGAELIGSSVPASSPYLVVKSGDKKLQIKIEEEVAWKIDSIIYYQEIDETLIFKRIGKHSSENVIGKTDGKYFIVENLENGKEYCFRADVYGSYDIDGLEKPLLNRSQIGCGIPNENILQCPPVLSFDKSCSNNTFILHWTNPNVSCDEEITGYNLYLKKNPNEEFKFLTYLDGENNTEFDVIAADTIKIGCFYVTGVDVLENQTIPSNIECYVPCLDFILPNVFSPNGDGNNDIYHPKWDKNSGDIPDFDFDLVDFDIEIFNRWGKMMYKTDDIKINWDGTNQFTGQACASGVYYYVCTITKKVGENAPETIHLTGYIHLFK